MPAKSPQQERFMRAVAHSPKFAKKVGVPVSVGKEFSGPRVNRPDTAHGKMDMPVANLNKHAGMKGGGLMKKHRFDEGGDIDSDPEAQKVYSSHGVDDELHEVEYKPAAKSADKSPANAANKTVVKAADKPVDKPANKPAARNAFRSRFDSDSDKRAAVEKNRAKRIADAAERNRGFAGGGSIKKMNTGGITASTGGNMGSPKGFARGGSIKRMNNGGMTAPMGAPAGGPPPQAPVDPRVIAAMQAAQAQGGGAPPAPPMMPPPPPDAGMGAPPPVGMKAGGLARFARGGGISRFGGRKPPPRGIPPRAAPIPPPMPPDAAPMAPPPMGMKKGGTAKYAHGGGIESRGKTKGTIIRMASGGSVSSRGDGIAQRGRTRA